jgi:hypothetical protein
VGKGSRLIETWRPGAKCRVRDHFRPDFGSKIWTHFVGSMAKAAERGYLCEEDVGILAIAEKSDPFHENCPLHLSVLSYDGDKALRLGV